MFPNNTTFCLSLTFDIEQCTNFPYWTCVWDHRKGAVDAETKRYVGKLADVAGEAGVKFQWFALGSSFEDDDVDYLRRLVVDGHAIGNHTYRHVSVKAKTMEQLQVTYRNDPSLAAGFDSPLDVMRHEIQQTNSVMRKRLGVAPRGFRTPGGFYTGLEDVPEVQDLLLKERFAYVSSHYNFPVPSDWKERRLAEFAKLAASQPANIANPANLSELADAMQWSITRLQPYRYPNGLLEIPMMGISDIWAFRVLDLEREEWIRLLEFGVDVACEHGLIFSVLMHPQVLASRDPHAATVRRLLAKAQEKGGWVTTNDGIAEQYSS